MNSATTDVAALASALTYAARGWLVLPVQPNGKAPLGALAPRGLRDATKDEATIRRWWAGAPDANVGIATGATSGLVVLDVDPPHGGGRGPAHPAQKKGPLPPP